MTRKKLVSTATASALVVILTISMIIVFNSRVGQAQLPVEPKNLQELVELPNWNVQIRDLNDTEKQTPFNMILTDVEGFSNVKGQLEGKGYQFDNASANVIAVILAYDGTPYQGFALSWWSSNVDSNGVRAFITAVEMNDGSDIVTGVQTNLLPPDQVPGIDPYIIVNAMPYMYVQPWWWVWGPWSRLVFWKYWWYDSHSHPNWYWGVYWWWRSYMRYYQVVWRAWFWWYWSWVYWRHWYWWSTYFPYV